MCSLVFSYTPRMFTPFIISQVLAFASVVMEVSSWQCKRRGVILFLLGGASVLVSLHFLILKEPFSATVILIVAVRFAVAMKTRNRSIMMLFLMVFVGIFFLFDDLRLTPLLALCGSLLATVGSFYPTDKGLRLWSAS